MKLWDIVKNVGSSVIKNAVPGGDLIIDVVNELLPNDKKLPAGATGDQMSEAINALPPEQQAGVLMRDFDVKLESIKQSNETLRTMLEADARSTHTTRPYIAKGAFLVVAFSNVVAISLWAYGVGTSDETIVKTVMDGWPFMVAIIGPLVTLLYAYFGVLKQEHKNRLDAAHGQIPATGLGAIVSKLLKR